MRRRFLRLRKTFARRKILPYGSNQAFGRWEAEQVLHKVAGRTYLVSDDEDISTPELIRRVAAALGRPARLFPFPPSLMRFAGKLFGKSDAVERLVGSLTIDSSKIQRELGWKPPYTMEQGLKETAEWFKEHGRARPQKVLRKA